MTHLSLGYCEFALINTDQTNISTLNQPYGIQDDNGVVSIAVKDVHMNHLGTVHATAIYGVAEAGSGQFIMEKFGDEFPDALAVTRYGTVKYKSAAKLDILAEVTNSEPDPQQALDHLAKFPIGNRDCCLQTL